MSRLVFTILIVNFLNVSCVNKTQTSLSFHSENNPKLSFAVNDGASFVANPNVVLSLSPSGNKIALVAVTMGSSCAEGTWQTYHGDSLPLYLGGVDGAKVISVKVKDDEGFESECITKSVYLDTTSPQFFDSAMNVATSRFNSLTSSPILSWSAAQEAGSGLSHYEYAIGSSEGGTDVLGWTRVDGGEVQNQSLSLMNNATYFPSVRAVDKAGNTGAPISGTWAVDLDPPTILTVLGPDVGTYYKGKELDFSITYSEAVNVTGSPRLNIIIGAVSRYAEYLSGSGTSTLKFRYIVQEGDDDADGISVTSRVDYTGGSIRDLATNISSQDFISPSLAAVIVLGCPANFVYVDSLSPYTTAPFCVAKYEMKIQGNSNGAQTYNSAFIAESRPSGTPWSYIHRDDSIAECLALGPRYNLMSNAQWQTIARNIEGMSWNWSTGMIGNAGGISVGHSDGAPNAPQAASADDSDSCVNTGQVCSLASWNSQRRIHRLRSGEYIWDFSGNLAEWTRDSNATSFIPVAATYYASLVTAADFPITGAVSGVTGNAKFHFGPAGDHTTLNSSPYGGLGGMTLHSANGTIVRGGRWDYNDYSGIFGADIRTAPDRQGPYIGFRCVYQH